MNDHDALRRANERFYQALENLDLPAMEDLWLQESWVQCLPPRLGGGGRVAERQAHLRRDLREHTVVPRDPDHGARGRAPRLRHRVVRENITLGTGEDLEVAFAHATNLFRKTPAGYKMVHHHASSSPVRVTHPFTGTIK